jgi:hypothetical protein
MTNFSSLLKDGGNIARILGGIITISGIIYQGGKLTQKVDNLIPVVQAQEVDMKKWNYTLNDIYGKICRNEQQLKDIDQDIKIIKKNIMCKNN